ncbi:hypothetical protein UFOVP1267_8 [uncultured Caudovirales phage]|uniref:Uncharacterized protein n=1 Tax=uncultured Caudovirales phage TaxID=2100421 RepID=A0A6J5RLZ9_9CAUD|nr:hypothetical protein UFOVP1267_8 [uncultured Caudovirales phage]
MATTTYLSSPAVTINSVNLQDQAHGLTFTRTIEALESTAFGSGSRVYTGGLENSTLTVDFYLSFAATETYATLKNLVGTQTTVSWSPSATSPGTATNPTMTLTGAYLEALPYEAALGALGQISVTFTGGVYSVVEV